MEIEKIEQIMKLLKQYDLYKVCIESENFKLKVCDYNKDNISFRSSECSNEKNINSKPQISNNDYQYIIKSSLVGSIAVLNNKLTGKKYAIGDTLQKGQVLCTIEAMKMLNEITCNEEGIITEILVEDGQFVEYEQPLFIINRKR